MEHTWPKGGLARRNGQAYPGPEQGHPRRPPLTGRARSRCLRRIREHAFANAEAPFESALQFRSVEPHQAHFLRWKRRKRLVSLLRFALGLRDNLQGACLLGDRKSTRLNSS